MQINYKSTRSMGISATASQAILQGLSPDGGLFVPEEIPPYDGSWEELSGLSYQETAFRIMRLFLTDYTEYDLRECIAQAYDSKFDIPQITCLREAGSAWYLELFHGATIAFKDMALSVLPHLMTAACRMNGVSDEIVILTATSGDTGKAAMAGFSDVPGTKIIVFYPKGGVSAVQERQMITQKGKNVHVAGISGNFDDAQSSVKRIFSDRELRARMSKSQMRFSSANSINIGRLVPQIVYYFFAYGLMIKNNEVKAGDPVNFAVPTGNFGNILAAYYASRMGLPVNKLICASNENKVLFDFLCTGEYNRNRDFILTSSPSMDILISSNLERLIYKISGDDCICTTSLMDSLLSHGKYRITPKMREGLSDFYGNYASEEETVDEIRRVHSLYNYVIDTHTAVASSVYQKYVEETGDRTKSVIVSTASAYKFAGAVAVAIDPSLAGRTDFELIDALYSISNIPIPEAIASLKGAPVLHDTVVDIGDMASDIVKFLGID